MNNQINKLIPKLRFPEFFKDGEWEINELNQVCDVFRGSQFSKADILENGNKKCIHYGELFTKYNETIFEIISRTNKKDGFESKIGDILMPSSDVTPNGLAKASAIMLDDVILGGDMNVLRPKQNVDLNSIFLSYLLNNSKTEIIKLVSGTTVKHIYASQIINCKVPIINSLKEQQKISNCLSSLDELLTAQNDKLETLKNHKRGLMQNLFPQKGEKVPKFRFKEFEKDGDWKETKLGIIGKFSKGKGISKSDIEKTGKYECIRYGELYTTYGEVIDEIVSRTNLSEKELIFSECNDVILPSSGETQIDIAKASCIIKKGIAIGGDVNIFKSSINGVFLSYYLNSAKKMEIAKLSQGISVVHLYSSQLENLIIRYPFSNDSSQEEQQKIADTLSSLDTLIKEQVAKIEQLKLHKIGLMQGLFPALVST